MAKNIDRFAFISGNATGVWFWYSIDGRDVNAHFAEAEPVQWGIQLNTTAQAIYKNSGNGAVYYGFQVSNTSNTGTLFDLVSGGLN